MVHWRPSEKENWQRTGKTFSCAKSGVIRTPFWRSTTGSSLAAEAGVVSGAPSAPRIACGFLASGCASNVASATGDLISEIWDFRKGGETLWPLPDSCTVVICNVIGEVNLGQYANDVDNSSPVENDALRSTLSRTDRLFE